MNTLQPDRKTRKPCTIPHGRKKLNDPTEVMRIPVAIKIQVLDLIAEHRKKFAPPTDESVKIL